MKEFLQLATLLFAIGLVATLSPASPLSNNTSATLTAAQSGPVLLAQAQDPAQQPSTQPQDQQSQNPNQMQQPDANGATPRAQGLPKTASPLPMFGLLGLISIGGIIVVRRISRTIS